MFENFEYTGLNHLELYCTLTIEAWLTLIAGIWNYEMHALVYILIVLNLRD